MKTILERESQTRVRLVIEVDPSELEPLYDETVRRLAHEVKVPGFRRGKVPRPVLETRVGRDAIRQEMLRDALPRFYAEAAASESLQPITPPELEVTSFEEGQPLSFTASVEVRPEIELPEYRGIEVRRADISATEEEVGAQLDQIRDRFASIEPVARNARAGDHLLVDLTAYRHQEKIDAASAKDLLYELGSGGIVPELDAELEGKRTGDILKFNAVLPERFGEHAGQEVSFSVIVKEVNAKRLPDLDDEFARAASEFDTLDELKAELRSRVEAFKKVQAEVELRNQVLDDLLDRAQVPLPESAVQREMQLRVAGFLRDLGRHGITLKQYLEARGMAEEDVMGSFRESAERAVAAQLVLEAVAQAEGIEVAKEDLDAEVRLLAERTQRDPAEVMEELEESGRVETLADDILRRKALEFLVEHAVVGSEGS